MKYLPEKKKEKGDKTDKELIEKSEKLVKEGDIYWLKAFKDLEGILKSVTVQYL